MEDAVVLESMERRVAFPTVTLAWNQEEDEGRVCPVYKETSYIVSRESEALGSPCFILFGFKVEEEQTRRYFLRHWKQLSGLAGLVLFLSEEGHQLVRASLLSREEGGEERTEEGFQLLVLVEVEVPERRLAYLLELVGRVRDTRNTGYLALYKAR